MSFQEQPDGTWKWTGTEEDRKKFDAAVWRLKSACAGTPAIWANEAEASIKLDGETFEVGPAPEVSEFLPDRDPYWDPLVELIRDTIDYVRPEDAKRLATEIEKQYLL